MGEEDRRRLYGALLGGLAREAQDRLCAADQQHDWSEWHRTALKKDIPLGPIGLRTQGVAKQEASRTKSERVCRNCGKRQVDG